MDAVQLAKLQAQAEALLNLAIRAHERFLFLRPMMVSRELQDRFTSEDEIIAFTQLRTWLYWGFVQELLKIWSDADERTPCISKIADKLQQPEINNALKTSYSSSSAWSEAELRLEFERLHDDFQHRVEQMLSSNATGGYKKVRDKLIAHNELRQKGNEYQFYDVKEAGVKYGEERQLLETVKQLVVDLLLLVCKTDFSWDSFVERETRIVCDFWKIKSIE